MWRRMPPPSPISPKRDNRNSQADRDLEALAACRCIVILQCPGGASADQPDHVRGHGNLAVQIIGEGNVAETPTSPPARRRPASWMPTFRRRLRRRSILPAETNPPPDPKSEAFTVPSTEIGSGDGGTGDRGFLTFADGCSGRAGSAGRAQARTAGRRCGLRCGARIAVLAHG